MELNENCCRLCLKDLSTLQPGENRYFPYFRIAKHQTLQLMILNCFDILITDDEVVNKVCNSCKDEVHHVNTIRKKVQAADYEIKSFYELLESRNEIEDLDKPQKERVIVSRQVEPELDLEPDKQKTISQIEDDTEGQNSKHEMDHNGEVYLDETEGFVVRFEDKPAKRKHKPKVPKISFSDFRCFICSTDFANQDELNNHLPTHVNPGKPQTCSICNQNAVTVRNLNLHIRRIHFRKMYRKTVPCDECRKNGIDREFSSNQYLEIHKANVHEGPPVVLEKKWVCSHCGKKFARASALRIHENIHTKAESFPCSMCSATFTSKTSLCRHEGTHMADKPFVCDQCGTMFRWASNLEMHKANRHSDDRPFGCEICGARFKVKIALSAHRKTHGKERMVVEDD